MQKIKQKRLKTLLVLLVVSVLSVLLALVESGNSMVFASAKSEDNNSFMEIRERVGLHGRQYARVYSETGGAETYEMPLEEEYVDYLCKELCPDQKNAETLSRGINNSFEVSKIIDNGLSDESSIVIVLMGDGYTAGTSVNQQGMWPNPVFGSFLYQAYAVAQTLVQTYPFNIFSHLLKVYAIQVVSNDVGISGAPDGTGEEKDTYFQTCFYGSSSIGMPEERKIQALELANSVASNIAMVQVLANADAHGGVSYWAEYSNTTTIRLAITATQTQSNSYWNPAWHGTVIHEFGHSFGQLIDEHKGAVKPTELKANVTQDSNPATVKWGHWIGYEGITIRPIENGWYVPSESEGCIMVASWANSEFCAVCSVELVRRMAIYSEEIFYGRHSISEPDTPLVTIPDGATRILPYAFSGNKSLQCVTIPSSIETLGDYAFLGARGLMKIINKNTNPQKLNSTVFANVDTSDITLVVPVGTTTKYIEAGWGQFNIVEWLTEDLNGSVSILGAVDVIVNTHIDIPSTINGKIVTSLSDSAFINQTQITSITIPSTVTSIGDNAFKGCTSLTSIMIPNSITEIGDGAFEGSTNLTSVTLPTTITKISDRMFKGCTSLNSFTISQNITEIGERAFMNSGLQEIEIPDTVTAIGDEAFYKCGDLSAVILSSAIEVIREGAFSETGIEKIEIPYGVEIISYGAFQSCINLTSVELPTSLDSIEDYAFCNTGIVEIIMPTNMDTIGECAFSSCSYLTMVVLPNNLTSLGAYAFYECTQLTNINLPNMLTEIKEETFYGCASLFNVVIPNSVTLIGNMAFYGCTSLEQMIIPNTVLNIGVSAFANCASMTLYVETNSVEDGWGENWADGCVEIGQTTLSSDNSYVVSFYKGSSNPHYLFMKDPARVGCTFGGWSLSQDFSGTLYTSGEICTLLQSTTLYAYWQGQTVHISYKDVGGTRFTGIHATGNPITHTNGADTVLLRPSKLNYTFIGWYLNSAGTGSPISKISGENSYSGTITLYAKWRKVTFTPITPTATISLESMAMITENGSYIDSEGNIYLVEEDIESYLNDTLTFYKKDDNVGFNVEPAQ